MKKLKFGDLIGVKTEDSVSNGLIKAVCLGEFQSPMGHRVQFITECSEIIDVDVKDVIYIASASWDKVWEQKKYDE